MPTSEISADWAAQRIKGLSLVRAVTSACLAGWQVSKGEVIKTLIDSFQYPRLGPGQMWEVAARPRFASRAGRSTSTVASSRIEHDGSAVTAFVAARLAAGRAHALSRPAFPLDPADPRADPRHDPPPPPEVIEAAESLKYRDFLTVVLIVDRPETFPDNWIYIHEPEVKLGRIQNFKNWSPDLVPDPSKSSLGLEYFCFEGDDLWTMPDADLIALGRREIDAIGLVVGRRRRSTAAWCGCPRLIRSTTTSTRPTSP